MTPQDESVDSVPRTARVQTGKGRSGEVEVAGSVPENDTKTASVSRVHHHFPYKNGHKFSD